MGEVVDLVTVLTCPECDGRLWEVIETRLSDGPYCRCYDCYWTEEEKK